jgi:hypothetical protein
MVKTLNRGEYDFFTGPQNLLKYIDACNLRGTVTLGWYSESLLLINLKLNYMCCKNAKLALIYFILLCLI